MMKTRRYILLATALVLLSACNNEADDIISGYVPSSDAIGFDVSMNDGQTTRAPGEISDVTVLQTKEIGVFASYTGKLTYENTTVSADFMYNQKVKWDGTSAWEYEPIKYWPNTPNEYVSFFAYAPYEADPQDDGRCIIDISKKTDLGNPWINYRLPTKPWGEYNTTEKKYENPKQIDLLFGMNTPTSGSTTPWLNQKKYAYNADRLKFTFYHALACVGDEIKIKLSSTTGDDLSALISGYAKIYIKKLTIAYKNLTTKGRLDLYGNGNATGASPNWKEIVSGELTTTRTLELNYDEAASTDVPGTLIPAAFKPDLTSTDDAGRLTYYGEHTGITATETVISTGKGLFYIPMRIAGTEAARADLTLEYQIINNIGKAYEGTATGSFPLDMTIDGKKQGINITINKDFKLGVLVYALADAASEPSYSRKH